MYSLYRHMKLNEMYAFQIRLQASGAASSTWTWLSIKISITAVLVFSVVESPCKSLLFELFINLL